MTHEFQIQPLAWIVKPKGADLFAETVTKIERADEGAGQFITITQQMDNIQPGRIQFDLEEWPKIREAVEAAFDAILSDELHTFAPGGKQ